MKFIRMFNYICLNACNRVLTLNMMRDWKLLFKKVPMHMKLQQCLILAVTAALVSACGSGGKSNAAQDAPPATNDNGNPVTAVITAVFNPAGGVVPLPNNLLFSGTTDLTLNIPIADPTAASAGPLLAINALDGWSTTAPWSLGTTSTVAPATVVPGSSVRMFEVSLLSPGGPVTGVVRELTAGVEYVATVSTTNPVLNNIVIVPLQPLDQITSYMAVVTNSITDTSGNNMTPDATYFIAKRTASLVDASGNSTDPLLDNATAQALEPLRQLTNAQEAAAASQGINTADIVVSWTATTQSITPVLMTARGQVSAQGTQVAQTPFTTADIGAAGIADIYIGVINLPYYLDPPTAENPLGPLNGNFDAPAGGYVPPFDAFGLDPTSTNVTLYNPLLVQKTLLTSPLIMTIPNAGSGQVMPPGGWPVVIYQHGITRNRTDSLAIADSMAQAGFAVVAIDQPLHGIASEVNPSTGEIIGPENSPFYIENTPFAVAADERTFDLDLSDNLTGAPGPDGFIDSSGTHTVNLASLLTSRDNQRQAAIDLATLTASIGGIDIDGDGNPDLDAGNIQFVGHSLGAMVGTVFLGMDGTSQDPRIGSATLSVPGGGIVGLLLGSPAFGPRIIGGLAAAGIQPGTSEFNSFVFAAITVIDSGDPINWGALAAATKPILLQEVVGSSTSLPDQVIPNFVPGFPLSGTEPLISVMNLAPITSTTQSASGIRGVTRFLVGGHGSLLSPAASFEATVEMQGEAVSMAASVGTAVQITIPTVLQGN